MIRGFIWLSKIAKKFFDFKVGETLIEINPTFTHNSTFTPFEYNKPLAKIYHKTKRLSTHCDNLF